MKLGRAAGSSGTSRAACADPALRAKLTPNYTMGCKRVLPTNDYLPALQRPERRARDRRDRRGARARRSSRKDGTERAVDAIVLATGFEAAEQVAPFEVRGRGGRDLDEVWRDGAEAYLGTAVAGFPNLFLLVGPNTGLGHSSMVFMIESQIAYVLDAVRQHARARAEVGRRDGPTRRRATTRASRSA